MFEIRRIEENTYAWFPVCIDHINDQQGEAFGPVRLAEILRARACPEEIIIKIISEKQPGTVMI